MNSTDVWKTSRLDDLFIDFFKVCKRPLTLFLANLATTNLVLEYYPRRFRNAETVVIPKPGKSGPILHTPSAYRPIALLSSVGKVVETAMCRRIAQAAEEQLLLPEGQMGNRPGRSTELAIRVVTNAVHTAWRHGATASLLQLYISGAFDTVNHTRLLDTMRAKGFPLWAVRWTRSFLTERTTRLRFDNAATEPIALQAGVPQGSPLSPILFVLYIASLYESLNMPGLAVVGFADDTNLIACSKDPAANAQRLRRAWERCERWARTRGMKFAPQKSELMHFTRAHRALTTRVQLGDTTIEPVESTRFLGIWLDRKLRWRRHLKKLQAKIATQQFAITKLAATTWGVSLVRARELYTKVVRSALAYGASAWHQPTEGGKIKGITSSLQAAQTRCLRSVAGAYRATPVHCLESELAVPPLDLYLNKRATDFNLRLEASGTAQLLSRFDDMLQRWLKRKSRRRSKSEPSARSLSSGTTRDQMMSDWRVRWEGKVRVVCVRRRSGYVESSEE